MVGRGVVQRSLMHEGVRITITLTDARHVPDFTHNLISISTLDNLGCTVICGGGKATFLDPDGKSFMSGPMVGKMYRIALLPHVASALSVRSRSLFKPATLEEWHRRFAHVSPETIRNMARTGVVHGLVILPSHPNCGKCEDCIMGKQSRRPFDSIVTRETEILGCVHVDLWGPASVQSTGGKLYMMLFVDGKGAHRAGYFLSHKDMHTTFDALEHFTANAERQTGKLLKKIRTDFGPEFVNSLWEEFCAKKGIIHTLTTPYSSAANGMVERCNRTVINLVRTCLHDSGLGPSFWAEAVGYALYVLEFVPTSRNPGTTPHESWTNEKPDVSHLRPFGCTVYAKIPDAINDGKLAPRSLKCILLGFYGFGAYRVMDQDSGKNFRSRDVVFEEGVGHRTVEAQVEAASFADLFPDIVDDDVVDPSLVSAVDDVNEEVLADIGGEDADGAALDEEGEDVDSDSDVFVDAPESLAIPEEDAVHGLVRSRDAVAPSEPVTVAPPTPAMGTSVATNSEPRRSHRLAAIDNPPVDESLAEPEGPRRSSRLAVLDPTSYAFSADITSFDDPSWVPKSVSEALVRPEVWKDAMDKEYAMMLKKGVWRLVERPPGAKTMKCGWVFANKFDGTGILTSRKARIVAKGFTQIPGLHFFESFAGVVRFESLRMMLAMAVSCGMFIWHADYVSAYLNAPNQVPILMEQPEGYKITSLEGCVASPEKVSVPTPSGLVYELIAHVPAGGELTKLGDMLLNPSNVVPKPADEQDATNECVDLVAVLDKSLYGTVDGARNWAKALDESMTDLDYYRSRADQSVRSRVVGNEHTVTCTYSDDITGISSTREGGALAVEELGRKYELKDLGEATHVVGLTLERNWDTGILQVHIRPFLERMLARFRMTTCSPKYTPLPPGLVLSKTQCPKTKSETEEMDAKPYREALGCLSYATYLARPDIKFAVTLLSRFANNPGIAHWKALLHCMAYVKATLHFKLTYGGTGFESFMPIAYTDSDFASDPDTRRSVTGMVFMQAGGPTAWGATYQRTVAGSTSEAEYMAMTAGAQQLEWMFSGLSEVGLPQPRPALLRADNTSAIFLANNEKHNAAVKHIDVREHYIRERIAMGDINVQYVPSAENIADIFTKPLGRVQHWKLCEMMRLTGPGSAPPSQGSVEGGLEAQ